MTKAERRDQRANKAHLKADYGRRNNRKSLEIIIQARNLRLAKIVTGIRRNDGKVLGA
jgi:hypothetical protein